MAEPVESAEGTALEKPQSDIRSQPSFQYQMVNFKARKIVTLIKISKLPYILEQVTELSSEPFALSTYQGKLTNQYEIIGYIVSDSFSRGMRYSTDSKEAIQERPALWIDIFSWAKMNERLIELRKTLFPMLQEFYRYVLGHEIVKKAKYDNLNNKIRKEILKLDQEMGQQKEIYGMECSYINIILACELFLGYKLVFQEKFRKSKMRLFSRCEQIYKMSEFEEIYGKRVACLKQYEPVEFQEEEDVETKKEEAIQIELHKLTEPWISMSTGNQNRNQLLYNFFRNTFKGQESKISYFPYFWLMYDHLLCQMVELVYENGQKGDNITEYEKAIQAGAQDLTKILKTNVDYGFLGIYFNEKQQQYRLQGILCLAESSFQDFTTEISKHASLQKFKATKLDIQFQQQRKKIEMFWQHQCENTTFDGIKLSLLRDF